ncbi:MAG: hypothetical protein FD157_1989 [Rhodocyclaceae bacterium]|nr:MAG: hypothetical protein FD157_1989 [Rhodocyclaceae bacterium]TND00933.1 MAG: hypothetical protein FD118_2723 [Rhodocyclaceae bacterium]
MEAEKKVDNLPGDAKAPKERSTIEFPYLDEENAVQIAEGVHQVGGSGCDWDQLAAHVKQAAQGGGFRLRLICAKQFGLVQYDRGKITLTSLGLRIVDQQQQKAAKVEAFLQVELYKALYEKFRGSTLPPVAGLEREIATLGVARKQADKARQAFQRSAKYAGFFDFGPERLVAPSSGSTASPQDQPSDEESNTRNNGNYSANRGGDEGLHPFVRGLIDKLPPPETNWALVDRAKWLNTAANIFDLMYKEPVSSDEGINVKLEGKTLSIVKGKA